MGSVAIDSAIYKSADDQIAQNIKKYLTYTLGGLGTIDMGHDSMHTEAIPIVDQRCSYTGALSRVRRSPQHHT